MTSSHQGSWSSREEAWRHFCGETGAEFIRGAARKADRVVAKAKTWTITLDSYTESDGYLTRHHTRMTVPYVSKDGFRFNIHREGLLSRLGKLFGMQDIEVGYPDLDHEFVVKANDESKVRTVLANQRIRELIQALQDEPEFVFGTQFAEGWFEARLSKKKVDELYFDEAREVREVEPLKLLVELFVETLSQLCEIGSASEENPGPTAPDLKPRLLL